MAGVYDGAVQELIDELGRLPGIGPKSAQRIAFYLLEQEETEVQALADAMIRVKKTVHFCTICGNVTEAELCAICSDTRRVDSVVCVVEEAKDVIAIERTREFRGRYHVLGGAINPIQGIGPENLRIRELLTRLQDGSITEVILATDPNIEGEATAAYLIRLLTPIGIGISRLASGLPVGGDLEYADEITLSRAFEGRTVIAAPTAPAPTAPAPTAPAPTALTTPRMP
ncbi:recombination mediator RecR [Actinotignum urinale]|uniref:Recombination protein RecR n=1 Tax=Actinotignum urinale TaxID=190146 RepID=A0ABU5G8M7_9ACTO|nr:recombination mediator RecR [Actinotignum urinale]MDY5133672.1 recombination mediator RecR [Actinotignum urinale]MDY5152202.1 recombination mediator RecR [Actinotignum urinale]MDY5159588.1 recombination mediator RecR [Actinotignum urinale]WIK58427.1 recombination mediator RecR [Actinotignum urinale]